MGDYERYKDAKKRKQYKKDYNKQYRKTHPPNLIDERLRNNKLRKTKKLQAVEYLGGKCSKCSYNKCLSALEFHHPKGRKKEQINMGWNWERIKNAIMECILVCSNCHREIHAGVPKSGLTGVSAKHVIGGSNPPSRSNHGALS